MAWVEVILALLSWRTVIWTLVLVVVLVGVLFMSSVTEAVVSIKAVDSNW